MKLLCPEILHSLRHKPIFATGSDGMPGFSEPSDKGRQKILLPLIARIHGAQKYIFDSGQDVDEKTVSAVRETAVEMVAAGLFHLPFPEIWVEDPFEEKPDEQRHLYFCAEKADRIEITHFQVFSPDEVQAAARRRNVPNVLWLPYTVNIPLDKATDEVFLPAYPGLAVPPFLAKLVGEVAYGVKKLIVTLATTNHERHHVPLPKQKGVWKGDPRNRPYSHTIIRIPDDDHVPGTGTGRGGAGVRRRRHLVRGYTWGRFTRPKEQQRWIAPFWRGTQEVETIERDHYEIR